MNAEIINEIRTQVFSKLKTNVEANPAEGDESGYAGELAIFMYDLAAEVCAEMLILYQLRNDFDEIRSEVFSKLKAKVEENPLEGDDSGHASEFAVFMYDLAAEVCAEMLALFQYRATCDK